MAMGNYWVNHRDANGQFFGLDDLVVSGTGFVVGYLSYGLMQHNWGGRALLSGLTGAVLAEASYLTLGGGLVAGAGANLGGMGSMANAAGFAKSFGFGVVSSTFGHREQLSNASKWSAYKLLSGYMVATAFSVGWGSKIHGDRMEKFWGFTDMDHKVLPEEYVLGNFIPKYTTNVGAAAIVSGFINHSLALYDPSRSRFYGSGIKEIVGLVATDYFSALFGQMVENEFYKGIDQFGLDVYDANAWTEFGYTGTRPWIHNSIPSVANGLAAYLLRSAIQGRF